MSWLFLRAATPSVAGQLGRKLFRLSYIKLLVSLLILSLINSRYVNSWLSVYQRNNYKYVAVQMHEIGASYCD